MGPDTDHDDWSELWRGVRLATVTLVAALVTATGVIAGGQIVLSRVLGDPIEAEAGPWLAVRADAPADDGVRLSAP